MDVLVWHGAPGGPVEVEYPSSDGMPMAETETHALLLTETWAALKHHFRDDDRVYVVGNIFLYYQEGDATKRRSPDVMVVKGVDATYPRNSFKTWVENAVPCVVIEFTSNQTEDEDQGPKKELYQELGVEEYFLFDPYGDWLPRPLVGYRLISREEPVGSNGHTVREYEELRPARDGSLTSHGLALKLTPVKTNLYFSSLKTGERLLTPPEAYAAAAEARREIAKLNELTEREAKRAADASRRADDEKRRADDALRRANDLQQLRDDEKRRADDEKKRADDAEERADDEKQRADDEKKRADDAEERLRKLAAEIDRLRSASSPPPAAPEE